MKDQGPWPKSQPTASDLSACARRRRWASSTGRSGPDSHSEILGRLEASHDGEPRILPKLTAYG